MATKSPKLLAQGQLTNDITSSLYTVPINRPGSSKRDLKATVTSILIQSRRNGTTNINIFAKDTAGEYTRILPRALLLYASSSFRFEPSLAAGTSEGEGTMVFKAGQGIFGDCQHGDAIDYSVYGIEESMPPGTNSAILAMGDAPTTGISDIPAGAMTLYKVPEPLRGQRRETKCRVSLIVISETTSASDETTASVGANQFILFAAKKLGDPGRPTFITPLSIIPDSGIALITTEILLSGGDSIKMLCESSPNMKFIVFGTEVLNRRASDL